MAANFQDTKEAAVAVNTETFRLNHEGETEERHRELSFYIDELKQSLEKGIFPLNKVLLAAVIKDLIIHALTDLQTLEAKCPMQDAVNTFIHFLSGVENNSLDRILDILEHVVSRPTIPHPQFIEFGAEIVHNWFFKNANQRFSSPGIIFKLFNILCHCSHRQYETAGNRSFHFSKVDSLLLEGIDRLLYSGLETTDSINLQNPNDCNRTALHHSAGTFSLLQVTKAILKHPGINPNIQDSFGFTPLLLSLHNEFYLFPTLPIVDFLTGNSKVDVSLCTYKENRNILDICVDFIQSTGVMNIFKKVVLNQNVTDSMIGSTLEKICSNNDIPSGILDEACKVLCECPNYDINMSDNRRQTICHKLALKGKVEPLEALLVQPGVKINSQDILGNSVLYYIVGNIPCQDVVLFIKNRSLPWDYLIKNEDKLNIYQYYLECRRIDQTENMKRLLKTKIEEAAKQGDLQAGDPNKGKDVSSKGEESIRAAGEDNPVKVTASSKEFFDRKMTATGEVYDMNKAIKGKAFVISIPVVKDKPRQDGYLSDSRNLKNLWKGIGFTVRKNKYETDQCLTAKEILEEVEKFADSFDATDQCAVLCILSHGNGGIIYGTDGASQELMEITKLLDNVNCKAMAGKPKVFVISACQGDLEDEGVSVKAGGETPPVPEYTRISPSISDTIIAYSSMPGYATYTQPSGSVFIKAIWQEFMTRCSSSSIVSMLTRVNKTVSEATPKVRVQKTKDIRDLEPRKQMSHFDSSLTKKLYFFPCMLGLNGEDWK